MIIDAKGIQFVKDREGFRKDVYLDAAGYPTVGYGTKLNPAQADYYRKYPITMTAASAILVHDLNSLSHQIQSVVKVALTANQLDALCSFCYNLGFWALSTSTMLKLLNKGDYESACAQFILFDHVKIDGKMVEIPGLRERRVLEQELFKGQI